MAEQYEYLVRGALLKCEHGSCERRLNLGTCHGVYITQHPAIHERDCKANDNIMPFGKCKKKNGACSPDIVGYWMNTYKQTKIVDNVPAGAALEPGMEEGLPKYNAVTMDSFLVCGVGGLIEPQTSGQETS